MIHVFPDEGVFVVFAKLRATPLTLNDACKMRFLIGTLAYEGFIKIRVPRCHCTVEKRHNDFIIQASATRRSSPICWR